MRSFCVAILLLTHTAWAAPADPLRAVKELEQAIGDADASWDKRYKAYQAVKGAIDAAKEEGKTDPAAKERAAVIEAAYKKLQPRVADALRRQNMPWDGWVMGFFGASLLWGGFMVCVAIAMKRSQIEKAAEVGDEV